MKMSQKRTGLRALSDECIEKLIGEVKIYPSLYDKPRKDYRDRLKNDGIWQIIAEKLEISGMCAYIYKTAS